MKKTQQELHPRDRASLVSKLTFWWLYPLLIEGYRRPLETGDLYTVQGQDASRPLGDRLARSWEQEVSLSRRKGRAPSYLRALTRSFGFEYLVFGAVGFLQECFLKILSPVLLGLLIRYFNRVPGFTTPWGNIIAALLIICNFAGVIVHHPFFYVSQCTGMKMRIASCSLIYRKALRLSSRALGQTTVGQLVNLLSNDVSRFDTSIIFLHYLWIGPVQVFISVIIMWYEIGPSCLAGVLFLVLFVPLQSYMGKLFSKLRLSAAVRTDERVRIMNEMVNAIRIIKMYVWEKPFNLVIERARKREISAIAKSNHLRAVNLTLFFTAAKIVLFLSLLSYALTGHVLTPEKVFVTSALINNVRLTMTLFFPSGISMGSEMLISCRRIQTFLEMEEKEASAKVVYSSIRPKSQDCTIEARSIYARWDPRSGEDTLRDVSFSLKSGEIMAVIGPVGSGKSSLIHTLLSELPIKSGFINVGGKLSYASQDPWLFLGTVKENILFGQPFDAKRYRDVVKVCALERDMDLFTQGDETVVGERGVALSGGQRARINLARAVYFDADIYLLDDPLSAVDANVGKHLFEQCISEFLKHKITILVTHQLQFIKTTSQITILRNGQMQAQGSYNQLKSEGIDFAGITAEEEQHQAPAEEKPPQFLSKTTRLRRASEAWSVTHGSEKESPDIGFDNSSLIASSVWGGSVVSVHEEDYFDSAETKKEDNEAQRNEGKLSGSVGYQIYMRYLLSGGGATPFITIAVLHLFSHVLFFGSDYYLSYWSTAEQQRGALNLSNDNHDIGGHDVSTNTTRYPEDERMIAVYIYSGITVALLTFAMLRSLLFFHMCMTSSRNLHNRMFAAVIRVPMSFFETHSIGQILNRFTKDIGQVDDQLPQALYDFITISLTFVGIIGMILYINIWNILPSAVLAVLFLFIRSVYISSGRDIKRLEGITRSPVFAQLSSTFEGLPTIRAFGCQQSSSAQFDSNQDKHTSAWYLFIATSRLFGLYLDLLCAMYNTVVVVSFMLEKDADGGEVGLGISLAMMLLSMLQWGVRQSAEVENHMTSVERIEEYSLLPPEVPRDLHLLSKEANWPSEGKITFENVFLRYNPEHPAVLKNLNFTIQPGEKIGIVGRTGAGKSSLLSCLFRLTPPMGNIVIDGVSTDTLQLEDLRRSLSIIPQDPTLFKGTVRYNLDPLSDYSDQQIWDAIEEVQLKKTVVVMNGKLSAELSEGGTNLSVGQRQLVCLARAILKRNKILVMDEATANVDQETDSGIQSTVREKFKDCTVLTIAHRLHTVVDCDRVMVMDSGFLMEFDSPYHLLEDQWSIFTDLVNQTGPVTSKHLKTIAKEIHEKNSSSDPQEIRGRNSSPVDGFDNPPKLESQFSARISSHDKELTQLVEDYFPSDACSLSRSTHEFPSRKSSVSPHSDEHLVDRNSDDDDEWTKL